MNSDPEVTEVLLDIEEEMRRMLDDPPPPYDAAWNIWGKAMLGVSAKPNALHPLWLIWGALTDWVEMHPEETPRAELKMRQAAKEWLELNHDDAAQEKAYCDRWVYDETGCARDET